MSEEKAPEAAKKPEITKEEALSKLQQEEEIARRNTAMKIAAILREDGYDLDIQQTIVLKRVRQ